MPLTKTYHTTPEAITDTVAVGAGVGVGGGANGGKASPYGGMEANPAISPSLRGETGPLADSAYVHPFLNMVTGKITSE